MIEKLDQFHQLIVSLPGYRFYGSSLFIVYDAEDSNGIDVRLIDFARCVTRLELRENIQKMTCPPSSPKDPDHGFLIGLQSIIQALENILSSQ